MSLAVNSAPALGVDSTDVLSVVGLHKRFAGVIALGGVDFSVRRGEVHALLGANGAGKSTLIKIVAGLYQPDSGTIYLDGQRVAFATPAEAMRAGVSIIYQDFALFPHLTVAENIFLGSEQKGPLGLIEWRKTHSEAQRLCDQVGVNFPIATLVSQLGAAQCQLVEIAKALRHDAKVLILDEPTASLSQAESERLFEIVRNLAMRGVGIIYVSHRLDEIASLAQRVTILRDGLSVGTFAAANLDRSKIVSLITGHERHLGLIPRARPVSTQPVLELRSLSRIGEFENVNVIVRSGEVVVLTGLVGAGRTELLETIFGIRQQDHGEIRLFDRSVSFQTARDAINAGIALIPEDRRGQGMSVAMPVYENIDLPILKRFMGKFGLVLRREIAHAELMISRLNIRAPNSRISAGSLSGGNQQKVVLAKWLSTDAKVILFDEPTQGVDVGAKDEIYSLINQLALGGRAILIVSSDLEEVLTIADRVIAMRAGKVVGEFAGKALSARNIVDAITHG